jgi:LPS-assembly lipoprotein
MSWRNKLLVLLLPSLLGGCGFKPLYNSKAGESDRSQVFAGVKIDHIAGEGRMEQQFRINLEDRLNPRGRVPADPAYHLATTLTSQSVAIGVARDGTVSRYNVYLDSDYALYRTADEKKIAAGHVRHVSSYNNLTNAYFSTYISEQDAIKRGVEELAEIYRDRLSTYLEEGAPERPNVDNKTLIPAPLPNQHFLGQGNGVPVPGLK